LDLPAICMKVSNFRQTPEQVWGLLLFKIDSGISNLLGCSD
jgi:hypothetical protein